MGKRIAAYLIIAGGSELNLSEGLNSVSEGAYEPSLTIVVDNSPDTISPLFEESFPDVNFLRPERPLTFSQAVNFGFRSALDSGAEMIFLLNDDTTLHRQALDILAEAEKKEGPGIFAPEIWPYRYGQQRRRFAFDWGKRLVVSEPVEECSGNLEIDYAEGSGFLVSAETIEKIGGFDEDFGFYFEDADFSIRAREAGFPVMEVAGARIWHKGSASAGKGLSPFKAYYRARNTMKFASKHRDKANLPLNFLYHFGGFIIPETLCAAARILTGKRQGAEVLASIISGTWHWVTGGQRAHRGVIFDEPATVAAKALTAKGLVSV